MSKIKIVLVGIITLMSLTLLSSCKAPEKVLRDDEEYLMYISHAECTACISINDEVMQYKAKADSDSSLMHFYKIDLKYVNYTDSRKEFGIDATPTLLYIKKGRIVKKAPGTDKVLELLKDVYGKL